MEQLMKEDVADEAAKWEGRILLHKEEEAISTVGRTGGGVCV